MKRRMRSPCYSQTDEKECLQYSECEWENNRCFRKPGKFYKTVTNPHLRSLDRQTRALPLDITRHVEPFIGVNLVSLYFEDPERLVDVLRSGNFNIDQLDYLLSNSEISIPQEDRDFLKSIANMKGHIVKRIRRRNQEVRERTPTFIERVINFVRRNQQTDEDWTNRDPANDPVLEYIERTPAFIEAVNTAEEVLEDLAAENPFVVIYNRDDNIFDIHGYHTSVALEDEVFDNEFMRTYSNDLLELPPEIVDRFPLDPDNPAVIHPALYKPTLAMLLLDILEKQGIVRFTL